MFAIKKRESWPTNKLPENKIFSVSNITFLFAKNKFGMNVFKIEKVFFELNENRQEQKSSENLRQFNDWVLWSLYVLICFFWTGELVEL